MKRQNTDKEINNYQTDCQKIRALFATWRSECEPNWQVLEHLWLLWHWKFLGITPTDFTWAYTFSLFCREGLQRPREAPYPWEAVWRQGRFAPHPNTRKHLAFPHGSNSPEAPSTHYRLLEEEKHKNFASQVKNHITFIHGNAKASQRSQQQHHGAICRHAKIAGEGKVGAASARLLWSQTRLVHIRKAQNSHRMCNAKSPCCSSANTRASNVSMEPRGWPFPITCNPFDAVARDLAGYLLHVCILKWFLPSSSSLWILLLLFTRLMSRTKTTP